MGDVACCTRCFDTGLTCRECFNAHTDRLADRIDDHARAVGSNSESLNFVSSELRLLADRIAKLEADVAMLLDPCAPDPRWRGTRFAEQPVSAADDADHPEPVNLRRMLIEAGRLLMRPPLDYHGDKYADDWDEKREDWLNRTREIRQAGAAFGLSAPAQGAPAAPQKPWPLNRNAWCCWCDRRDIPSAAAKDHWQQCEKHPANERIAALGARLATAERERDEAKKSAEVAAADAGDWAERASLARSEERERCAWHAEHSGTVAGAVRAIRDGRPAPK